MDTSMRKYKITKEQFTYMQEIERKSPLPLTEAFFFQVGVIENTPVIFRVQEILKVADLYYMRAEIKACFERESQAVECMRAMQVRAKNLGEEVV